MAPSTLILALFVLAGSADAMRVLVTGAGGRTGKLVFEQLSANTATTPVRQITIC
jgi:FlaA1/EpsC-like NDP-sugar epimerase